MLPTKPMRRLLWMLLMLAVAQGQAAPLPRYYRDCWLLFGGVDDIGYSHSMNLGRLEINRRLGELYPSTKFESVAYPGVFFMPAEDKERLINQTIMDGCNMVVSSSAGLFDELAYARLYPNVSFVGGAGQEPIDATSQGFPPNLALLGLDWFDAAFVSGVVAAATISTKGAGFINAFESRSSTWGHAMGFALGYRTIRPHQPLHIVTMDSYYNPEAEVEAAKLLVHRKGCDLVNRHTDPNDVDKYINSLATTTSTTTANGVRSMARYVDMSTFVGDTVVTCQTWSASDVYFPVLQDSFLASTGSFGSLSLSQRIGNDKKRMQLSPYTSLINQTMATDFENAAWDYLAKNNPTCGTRWRSNGQVVSTTTIHDNNGTSTVEECWDTRRIPLSYLRLPNVTYYDHFQDGGAVCRGGRYYEYDDDIKVHCHPCPTNTYAGNQTRALEGHCTPCPPGTVSNEGSFQCTKVHLQSNTPLIAGVVLGAIGAVLLVIAISYFVVQRRHTRDNRHAPKHPHQEPGIAVLFTDIQASTTLWANAPVQTSRAVEIHHELIRAILHRHGGYEVKTIGDAFMVAIEDASKAVAIALDIQRDFLEHDWESAAIDDVYQKNMEEDNNAASQNNSNCWNGLRVRVGIAYGTCQGQKDPVTGGWDYYGSVVNTAARTEAAAHGGQVLVTGPAYQALLQGHKEKVVRKELGIREIKSHGFVSLRGLKDPIELLEVTPIGVYAKRQFPPLRVDDPDEENGSGDGMDEQEEENNNPNMLMKDTSAGSHSLHRDDIDLHLSNEEQLDRLMTISLRRNGIRRYDDDFVTSAWKIYHSTQSMLSLMPAEEREALLTKLVQMWHVSTPKLSQDLLTKVGPDTPKLVVLAIRAATVAMATGPKGGVGAGRFMSLSIDLSQELFVEEEEEKEDKS